MSHIPVFNVCSYLKVYNDMGLDPNGPFGYSKSKIASCECELYLKSESCTRRGNCLTAREKDTWKRINSKSYKEEINVSKSPKESN